MPLDLENIPADERKRLVELGSNFSSQDTLKQADHDNHHNKSLYLVI